MDYRIVSGLFQQFISMTKSYDGNFYQFIEYLSAKFPDLFHFVSENYELCRDYWNAMK